MMSIRESLFLDAPTERIKMALSHKIIRTLGIIEHYQSRRAAFIMGLNNVKRDVHNRTSSGSLTQADRVNLRQRARGLNDRIIVIARIENISNDEAVAYQTSALRLQLCAERAERWRSFDQN